MLPKTISLAAIIFCLGSAANAQTSPWRYTQEAGSLTDLVRHGATTNGSGRTATFICAEGEEPRFAVWNSYLDIEMGDTRTVTGRIDGEPAVTETWSNLAGNGGGAGAFGEPGLLLARAVRDASEGFVIRSGGETQTYSVSGSTAAIAQALEACGYED